MKKLLAVATICALLGSCRALNLANDKKTKITDLGIDWSNSEKVSDVHKLVIDSVMSAVMVSFNRAKKTFLVHKK